MLREDNKRIDELEKQIKDINMKIKIEFPEHFKKIFALLDIKANLDDLENSKFEITSLIE